MSETIIVALLSLLGSLGGTLGGIDGDVVKIYLPPTITTINMDFFRNKYQNLNTIYVENDSDAVTVTGDQTGISIMYKPNFVFENIIVNAISALTTQLKALS